MTGLGGGAEGAVQTGAGAGVVGRVIGALRGPGRRREWRRFVVRRVAAAGCAVVAVLAGASLARQPGEPVVPVLVAARPLGVGEPVSAATVRVVPWPRRLAPAGALEDVAQVLGRRLVSPVGEGEALTAARFSTRSLLAGRPVGEVAVHVGVTDAGSADMVAAGDRIDLVASGRVLARDLLVLRVDRPVQTDFGASLTGGGSSSGFAFDGSGLVVAASPDQAEAIAAAPVDAAGRPDVRVLLRSG